MTKAATAERFVTSMAAVTWPDDAVNMAPYVVDWLLPILEYRGSGTHKYIPTEALNQHFGLPQGAGVYSYVSFDDDSYLLRTCNDGVKVWDAKKNPHKDGKIVVDTDAESCDDGSSKPE